MRCSVLGVRKSSLLHVAFYSVLQCVAVCCSALQCVAVRCSALQCVAVRCSALQCVAVRCSALQCVAVFSVVNTSGIEEALPKILGPRGKLGRGGFFGDGG